VAISGAAPLELLGAGAHRLRLVGTRALAGAAADATGAVAIGEALAGEVAGFDAGTTATVRVAGAAHTVVRHVPLREPAPWLWLLLPVVASLLAILLRARGTIRGSLAPLAPAIVLVATAPVLGVALSGLFLELLGAAAAAGAIGALLSLLAGPSADESFAA
jgi:hypothetical protein